MQVFYLSCLTGGNIFLNCLLNMEVSSPAWFANTRIRAEFSVLVGGLLTLEIQQSGSCCWEENMRQNGLAPFAVPEHITSCWLCWSLHCSWKLSSPNQLFPVLTSNTENENEISNWCKLLPPPYCTRGSGLAWDFRSSLWQSLYVDKDTIWGCSLPDKRTGSCSKFTMVKFTGKG